MQNENFNSQNNMQSVENGVRNLFLKKGKRPHRAFHNLSVSNISKNQLPPVTQDLNSVYDNGIYGDVASSNPNQMNFQGGNVGYQNQGSSVVAQEMNSVNGFENPQSGRVFTPKHFDSPLSTPSVNEVINQGSYAFHSPNNLPIQSMSHIIAKQRWEDQLEYLTKSFNTKDNSIPPLSTTQYYCNDQGSCDPRLLALTMYNIPKNEHFRSATKLPLGLTIQPFAKLIPNENIPLVESTQESGPLRCNRCRAYVNPSFQFTYDSSVVCNICKMRTKLSNEHFAPLGPDGNRSDMGARPDLYKGCVDFAVPDIYNCKAGEAPLPLHYVFLIDVSLIANENGSSLAAVEGVRSAIEYIGDFQPKCKVAIISYDSKLKFYNLSPELASAQEYVITEINDVFLPFYEGLFVRPNDSTKTINDTLRKISQYITMDKFSHVPHVCYGSALEAAKLALDTVTNGQGGKIVCTLNSLPTIGNGNLSLRKDDNMKRHLKCDNDFYSKLAREMLSSYISLDLYVTSAGFVDMATVAHPVYMTSGNLKYYPHFIHEKDEFTLVNDMTENIASITGYQALLKIRCSSGLAVYQYYMGASEGSDRDPIIPVLTSNTTIDVLLKYVEKLKEGTDMSFQAALLYTNIDGDRRVRSINTSGAVSGNIREIFKFLNQQVILRIMVKDILNALGDADFAKVRQSIDDKMVDILTQYRALVSGNSSSQLVLPDTLKTLPTYMLSFQKSELMKPNAQSTRDNQRVYDLFKYYMFNRAQFSYKLYPQIIPTHVLLEDTDLTFYDAHYQLLMIKQSSIDNVTVKDAYMQFTDGGCYLIFNGETCYLWFNENTNKLLLEDLLDVGANTAYNQITLCSNSLPKISTHINKKANNTVKNWTQTTNKSIIPVILLRPNVDQYYSKVFTSIIVEDPTMNKVDSADNYLVNMHRRIQENLTKTNYVEN
ncbi:hypothetical protein TPHA_0E01930 [Tetrapisispora phaffii CBS 4417]|uniref:VWFA domain-containing protein n=1 Tax=Tetrapisispora phaffii (strain ATCC 24235 / CBS 4417 / NBRC 1672 / NRRL Y-8282 / UCD 70-5) TaxID=1071381 RepID=G8BTQ7_TETPH|nr:hypothetical protein TPHA_0E01930 [Tetrapisispora phaffii CBS 4417]CCE63285.1 hypothetical protein TPHA_0E01930 [Tetrapisispora phaffii CBS 4417]